MTHFLFWLLSLQNPEPLNPFTFDNANTTGPMVIKFGIFDTLLVVLPDDKKCMTPEALVGYRLCSSEEIAWFRRYRQRQLINALCSKI